MIDEASLGVLTTIIFGYLSIFLAVKRPVITRIIYIVILVASTFSIYAFLLEPNRTETISFTIFIAMITVISLLISGRIISDIRNRGMEHEDIISHNMNKNSTLAKDCIRRLRRDICGLAEECIIAINYKKFNEATQISETLIGILDLLGNHTLTYYLRIAIFEFDDDFSRILNSHGKSLEKIPFLIEKDKKLALKVLESFIFTIYPDYNLNRLRLIESKAKELREIFSPKKTQYDENEIIKRNLELWEKYVPFETPSSARFLYIFFVYSFFDHIAFPELSFFIYVFSNILNYSCIYSENNFRNIS